MIDAHELDALHEAATPAPWRVNGGDAHAEVAVLDMNMAIYADCDSDKFNTDDGSADAALIVALRNVYASGDLVPRTMVEELEYVVGWLASHDFVWDEATASFVDRERGLGMRKIALEAARAAMKEER